MKCPLLVAFSVVLASFSGRAVAAPADSDRMLAAPTPMFTELTYQTPDDYSRFQGEQQEAFWKWLEPAARPASR